MAHDDAAARVSFANPSALCPQQPLSLHLAILRLLHKLNTQLLKALARCCNVGHAVVWSRGGRRVGGCLGEGHRGAQLLRAVSRPTSSSPYAKVAEAALALLIAAAVPWEVRVALGAPATAHGDRDRFSRPPCEHAVHGACSAANMQCTVHAQWPACRAGWQSRGTPRLQLHGPANTNHPSLPPPLTSCG